MAYILQRTLTSLLSLVGLLVAVFLLIRLTGNPAELYLPINASADTIREFSARNGFDDPVIVQFGRYLSDLLRLDFGVSVRQGRSAMEIALQAYPATLSLGLLAMALATVAALIVGPMAAYRPGGLFDRFATLISLICASAPEFWIAIVMILVFAVNLGWVPTSGSGGPQYWILPVAVLALRPFGLMVQVMRGSMISALSAAYVKTARANGLSEVTVVFGHALRNSLLPLVTVAGTLLASLLNGAVVIETIFGWPGIGRLMIDSITQRDFPVVQAAVLVTACAIFTMNLIIDLLYTLLDPRIRYD